MLDVWMFKYKVLLDECNDFKGDNTPKCKNVLSKKLKFSFPLFN